MGCDAGMNIQENTILALYLEEACRLQHQSLP